VSIQEWLFSPISVLGENCNPISARLPSSPVSYAVTLPSSPVGYAATRERAENISSLDGQ